MTLPMDIPVAPAAAPTTNGRPTPLAAVCGLTFLCSIGTGVVWAGVPFIAKHEYDLSQQTTLLLYLTLGVTYVLGALSTGAALRQVERAASPRSVLAVILVLCAIFSASLWFISSAAMLWIAAIAINILSSWLWPIIESYLTAGRHGAAMRKAMGIWNLTWTGAVLGSLLLMAPLVAHHAAYALVGTSVLYVLGLAILPLFAAAPAVHFADQPAASAGANYPALLKSARWLLLASYVLNSAMSPLLPFLIARLAVPAEWATPVAATWTAARVAVMAAMAIGAFWHGRWGTLLLGGVSMAIGFALIVAAAEPATLIAGLALLGAGMGIIYYAALYYAMSVGHAEVDAGSKHEALIGLGYTAGPLAGLIGEQAARSVDHASFTSESAVIVVVGVVLVPAMIASIRPYVTIGAKRP